MLREPSTRHQQLLNGYIIMIITIILSEGKISPRDIPQRSIGRRAGLAFPHITADKRDDQNVSYLGRPTLRRKFFRHQPIRENRRRQQHNSSHNEVDLLAIYIIFKIEFLNFWLIA